MISSLAGHFFVAWAIGYTSGLMFRTFRRVSENVV